MPALESGHPEDRPRVLVVDDEKFIRDIIADFLGMEGYIVRTAEDGTSAVTELERARYDMVISDLKMPKMGGLDLLKEVARVHPDTLTVIMTGFGTVETAIDAMKRGAYDYILKPFKVEEIVHIVQRGLEKRRLAAENLRLREALSLYKVSEAIAASLSLDEVVSTLSDSALSEVRSDVVMTWLADGEGDFTLRSLNFSSLLEEGEELGGLDPAKVVERLASGPVTEHGARARELFATHPARQVSSLIIVPLKMRDRLLGFVATISLTASRRFDEGQRKLLSIIASRAAAAIENARLYEDLQATFQQTIQSLARTIDKMDRYTAGHSERVARYAVNLARWLGLDEIQIEVVRHSALMHDIGKIGCVMNLNKAGKLTQTEYEVFKRHPTYGREILDPIKFLGPVIPGVHLHHERWDGRGYPLGLAGKDIPLIARIISVADTYDAMTSDRAYRRALPHEVTVSEIERCSGTQFDPDVAGTFTERIEMLREELRASGVEPPE
ncbi:MAG: putative regulatory protein [Polyangiaceae bacterium]|jgi:putative nucleotidyltransferase with HDIG domain|nr:putative regulatory protein [Polyangiaceae bacterium]